LTLFFPYNVDKSINISQRIQLKHPKKWNKIPNFAVLIEDAE
jgi:hypothetical protein